MIRYIIRCDHPCKSKFEGQFPDKKLTPRYALAAPAIKARRVLGFEISDEVNIGMYFAVEKIK